MEEFQVPVVIEVMLERVTNISMGTEIDEINEFEELADTHRRRADRDGRRHAGLNFPEETRPYAPSSPPTSPCSSPSCPSSTASTPPRQAGFDAVEFLFPYAYPKAELAAALRANGLKQVLHNLPAGDWDAGERGIACHPDRVTEFRDGVARAIEYANALGCPQVNCLAGKLPAGVGAAAGARRRSSATCASRPRALQGRRHPPADRADQQLRHPRLLPDPHRAGAGDLIDEVGSDNLFLQYDIYHAQRMEGELAATLQQAPAAHRPHPARRQPRPQRAGHRRDQLPLPVPAHRPLGYSGCDRLRIQAAHHHRAKAWAGRQALTRVTQEP